MTPYLLRLGDRKIAGLIYRLRAFALNAADLCLPHDDFSPYDCESLMLIPPALATTKRALARTTSICLTLDNAELSRFPATPRAPPASQLYDFEKFE